MKARKIVARCALMMGLLIGVQVPTKAHDPLSYWWHTYSQSQRNSLIVNQAVSQIGTLSGLSCKKWVQRTIRDASVNHVSIPLNKNPPLDYLWEYDPYVVAMGIPVQDVVPGYVIQMRTIWGWPHTVIVTAKTSTHVTFVESNYDTTPFIESDAKVTTRTITFATFYSQVEAGGAYFVYKIL